MDIKIESGSDDITMTIQYCEFCIIYIVSESQQNNIRCSFFLLLIRQRNAPCRLYSRRVNKICMRSTSSSSSVAVHLSIASGVLLPFIVGASARFRSSLSSHFCSLPQPTSTLLACVSNGGRPFHSHRLH